MKHFRLCACLWRKCALSKGTFVPWASFFPYLNHFFSARIGIYPSPFIFSPETPINTGALKMKSKNSPFITCHLNAISAFIEDYF